MRYFHYGYILSKTRSLLDLNPSHNKILDSFLLPLCCFGIIINIERRLISNRARRYACVHCHHGDGWLSPASSLPGQHNLYLRVCYFFRRNSKRRTVVYMLDPSHVLYCITYSKIASLKATLSFSYINDHWNIISR